MRLLLDTHIMLWAVTASERMPVAGRNLVTSAANRLYCSTAAVWEVAIKYAKGGDIPMSGTELLSCLQTLDVGLVPITPQHGAAVGVLPMYHRDPFDRLMVAQALAEGMTFLTADRRLAAYGDHVVLV